MGWNIKYVVVAYLAFGIAFEAAARSYRKCPPLRLRNGSVKLRPSGRMAKFTCNYPYELVGNTYAQCTSGSWEVNMPICIKSGCKDLPAIANGVHDITHDGALARYFCHYGFELEGPRELYCNGYNWSDMVPKCRGTKEASMLSCNFDSGMCGWDDDELHDFNWRRKATGPNVTQLNWWPAVDHTNSSTGQGGYVYIDRQSIFTNKSAKLVSPSYHSDLTKKGCFSFYYYRSNYLQGTLKVYQKPDSIDITTLTTTEQGRDFLRFEAITSGFRRWQYGFFYLNETDEDFQIVIEGYTRIFQGSFIAVDDVMIQQGHQCVVNITTEPTPVLDFRYSCRNRCGARGFVYLLASCGCEESCLLMDTCCADFREVCEFGTEEDTITDESTTESTATERSTSTSARTPKPARVTVTYPSSRNLVTQQTYSNSTLNQTNTTIYNPSLKSDNITDRINIIYHVNRSTSVPVSKTTSASKFPTSGETTRIVQDLTKSFTEKPISTTAKKIISMVNDSLISPTTNKQIFPTSAKNSPTSIASTATPESHPKPTTRAVASLTTTPRFYAADGKTAQANETHKVVKAERAAKDEKSSYSYRMQVTTICLAVFLCVCGASVLIMFVVMRRNQIRWMLTRLRIRTEFAKSSHVGKEGEVRFLIREDEVDME